MRKFLPLFLFVCTATALAQDVHVKVDPNGGGSIASTDNFPTIQNALDHAPQAPHGRIFIHIAPGVYHERINVTRLRPRVTLLGEGKRPEDVVIAAAQFAKQAGGTYFTETAQVNADDFEADNITFENTAGPVGQAVAATIRSDRAIFKHCRFLGDQDTLFADFGRQYYLDSYVEGGVDFIFGNATAVFDHTEIHIIRPGFLTAQSRTAPEQTTGYVITNSRVTSSIATPPPADPTKVVRTGFFLGRPWRPYSRVVVMNTELPADLSPAGWSAWGRGDTTPLAFYAEYKNTGPGAATGQRVPWSHQLTAKEAAHFAPTVFLRGADHWDPVAEAAKLP
ncbi:MAG TPA: pectinesterase family protein [Acidobacteriaceae bacterium]